MANYKYQQVLAANESGAFDQVWGPSDRTPHSGVYRCETCFHEIAANKGNPLPPQNHAQHPAGKAIIWRLVVACAENPQG
jgi:hypothetical protein